GSYVVSLTVTDQDGVTATTQETIPVADVAPQVEINGPDSANAGDTIDLTSTMTDVAPLNDAGPFTYAWVVSNSFGQIESSYDHLEYTAAHAGTDTVSLVVTDGEGLSSDATTWTIEVDSIPPTVC